MWKKFWANKKLRIIVLAVIAALLVTAAAVIIIVNVTKNNQSDPGVITFPGITPDYPAPPVEEGAMDIAGGDEGKLEAPEEGGSAVGLIYSDEVTIDLSDKKATLDFRNPKKSLQNMSVQVVIQDQVVAESGLLLPGKRIKELSLKEGMETKIPAGYYNKNAKFLIRFYDPETNECAIINSEIALKITVQE